MATSHSPETNSPVSECKPEESDGTGSKRRWEKPYELPPCRICGSKGSGLHYGVNTCEACKAFFRRGLSRYQDWRCKNNSSCVLEASNQRMCGHCRFNKCLKEGMSVDGISHGRYTFTKRFQDAREVQKRKAEESEAQREAELQKKLPDIQKLISKVSEAGKTNPDQWNMYNEEFAETQADFLNKFGVQGSLFEQIGSLPPGDNRADFYKEAFSRMETVVQKKVKFAKAVPGFKELPMDDQIALFKAAFPDLRILSAYDNVNVSDMTFRNSVDIRVILGEVFGGTVLRVARRLQMLDLKEEELDVLRALVIFTTDRCELQEPQKVEAIHDSLLDALMLLLKKNHSDKLIFPKLVSALVEMRSLGKTSHEYFSKVVESNGPDSAIEVPKVFSEILMM